MMKYPMPFPKPKGFPEYTEKECRELIKSNHVLLLIDFLKRKGVDVSPVVSEIGHKTREQELETRKEKYSGKEYTQKKEEIFGNDTFAGTYMILIRMMSKYFSENK